MLTDLWLFYWGEGGRGEGGESQVKPPLNETLMYL